MSGDGRRGRLPSTENFGVVIIAKMDVAEKVDRQQANRNLIRFDHAIDVDDRRESHAAAPERLQFQEQSFVEPGVGCDLVIGAAGNRVDRFAERAQRTLI